MRFSPTPALFGPLSRKGKRIPGAGVVSALVQEVAEFGMDRLAGAAADVPGIKPAGEAMAADERAEIRSWLEALAEQCSGMAERLEERLDRHDRSRRR